jgi:hypothetical protein
VRSIKAVCDTATDVRVQFAIAGSCVLFGDGLVLLPPCVCSRSRQRWFSLCTSPLLLVLHVPFCLLQLHGCRPFKAPTSNRHWDLYCMAHCTAGVWRWKTRTGPAFVDQQHVAWLCCRASEMLALQPPAVIGRCYTISAAGCSRVTLALTLTI